MMKDGLVNDQIKRQVLESLKPVVINSCGFNINGDLKETVPFLILQSRACDYYTHEVLLWLCKKRVKIETHKEMHVIFHY